MNLSLGHNGPMDILSKHKKKGLQGFKDFIYYLELADSKRLNDVLAIAWLEDPVYTQYLEPNMVKFDFFLSKLEDSDYEKIFKELPNGAQTFTFAFKGSKEHEEMMKRLPVLVARKIGFAEETVPDIAPFQRAEARSMLMKKMRELQERNAITSYPWKLPTEKVLKGEHFAIPSTAPFQLKFENGKIALEGAYDKKLRTGTWSHYLPDGNLYAKGPYTQGEKIGTWTFYYPSGKQKWEGQYKEDLRTGEWKSWNEAGELITVLYERGRLI